MRRIASRRMVQLCTLVGAPGASFEAASRRLRTGSLSARLPDFRHCVAVSAELLDKPGLAREMQRANGDERAARGQKRRGPLGHDRVAVLKQSAHEFILRRALSLAQSAQGVSNRYYF